MLFSEPKISQYKNTCAATVLHTVSVLFSEPKISQFVDRVAHDRKREVSVLFSEPKISQSFQREPSPQQLASFSALQRAENFSIWDRLHPFDRPVLFQCSSASRKFLNHTERALERHCLPVSVLFSEPKISQCSTPTCGGRRRGVSVLFSEPKISQ